MPPRHKTHMIHGRPMTVPQIAEALGVRPEGIETWLWRHRRKGERPTLEEYWDWRQSVARGEAPPIPPRPPAKHLIHGQWMTRAEVAARLGVGVSAIIKWREHHRRPDGSLPPIVEYWDYLTGCRSGETVKWPGREPRRCYVDGKRLSIAEAADRLGVNPQTLRGYLLRHRCSLQSAVRFYENRAKDRAVKDIMAILNEARR